MRLATALGWTAGAAALAFGAWAVYFGAHFADSESGPRAPTQGRAGDTWRIVLRASAPEPVSLGQVLRAKVGTAQDGGEGNMVYIVRLDHDVALTEGRDVLSMRRAVPGDLGQVLSWP